tara:strand:- start:392 stop:1372 length:981 start_codon:yes stop_codon:yes gene_type:complete
MDLNSEIGLKEIVKAYKVNYAKILHEFIGVQSDFLSDIYNRYDKDLDAANIVLFFAKNLHELTLRERDRDLDFNISFENFWLNHERTKQNNCKIIDIAESTGLPKETARRKVNNLIKNKVLQKNKNLISWSPAIDQRKSYNKVVDRQINQISKLVQTIAVYLEIKISKEKINSELRKHFSFFWFHYIKTQLQYLKMWQKEINDLELILIAMQCIIQTNISFKKANAPYEEHFASGANNLKFKNEKDLSVSATSISEVTGVPRATCIRKLERLNKMKIVKKDPASKRYYVDLRNMSSNGINSRKIAENTIEMFSEFYLIVLKALRRN